MNEQELKRKLAEEAIFELMKAIKDVYLGYNPNGGYLSMFFNVETGYYHVNNASYDKDLRCPLDASWFDDGEKVVKHQITVE